MKIEDTATFNDFSMNKDFKENQKKLFSQKNEYQSEREQNVLKTSYFEVSEIKDENKEILGIDDNLQNELQTDLELCYSEQTEKVWPQIGKEEVKQEEKPAVKQQQR